MSRRQVILETLLIFALFCLQGAWPVPDVNEPYYLGKAIHYWNPQWASSDWFLKTTDTHSVFYFSVGWLSLVLAPTVLAWTLRLITWALLAWSWQRLSAAVVPRAWIAPLTATLFLFLLQHFNMAGEWVVGGAESKGFSFALVFFALAAMMEGYWNRMWLLLGLATAFHALVGGWAAVAAGAVWIVANPKARSQLSSWLAPLAAFLIALPGVLPPLLMNRGVNPATVAQAEQIYVFKRFPHHLDPLKMWNDGFVVPFLVMAFAWLLLWKTAANSPAARRLRGFTVAALALAAIGTVFGLLGRAHPAFAARWMHFYWFRLADVAVPLGLSIAAVRWFAERKMRAAIALAIGVAVFHAADCAVLRLFADPPFGERQVDGAAWRAACLWTAGRPLRPIFPRQPRADRLRNFDDWLKVCCWVADPQNTPPEARFLVPRNAQTFKWYAARGEVVNWKESPQDAAGLVAWWARIQDIYATGNPPPQEEYYSSLADAGAARLRDLARKYRADYLVTQVSVPLLEPELKLLYKNDSYVVYDMR
jgi:hypothetical protein